MRGVDIAVGEGEIYGFLGPNGAGKTTTVRMLTTLLLPTGGRATVAGHDVVAEARQVRASIGVALQEAALDPLMTGRELIRLQATLQGLPGAEGRRRADDLLERVDLADAADRRVGAYSGGMQRRLDLAAALVHEPRVLFLDEPTTGLDPVSRKTIWEEVRALNDEGTTVFLTTQYLEEADQLADNVGIIDSGRIVAEGTPAALKAEIGSPHIRLQLEEGSIAEAEEICAPDRAAAAAGRRQDGPGRGRARRRRHPPRRAGARRGGDRGRLAGAGPPQPRRRLRRQDRPPPGARGARTRRRSRLERPGAPTCGSSRALGMRSIRQTFRRPQLMAPIVVFPTMLLAIQTGGAGGGRRTAGLPAGAELPPVHARRGDDAVADAGRQQRRDRARRRHRDGLHRPPLRGADLALHDRPRPARRDRRAGPLLGALVPRDRAGLRRRHRGRRRRGAAGDRPGHDDGDGGRRDRRGDRPAHRQRQRRPGPLPAGPRRPLPLLGLLPGRT